MRCHISLDKEIEQIALSNTKQRGSFKLTKQEIQTLNLHSSINTFHPLLL